MYHNFITDTFCFVIEYYRSQTLCWIPTEFNKSHNQSLATNIYTKHDVMLSIIKFCFHSLEQWNRPTGNLFNMFSFTNFSLQWCKVKLNHKIVDHYKIVQQIPGVSWKLGHSLISLFLNFYSSQRNELGLKRNITPLPLNHV